MTAPLPTDSKTPRRRIPRAVTLTALVVGGVVVGLIRHALAREGRPSGSGDDWVGMALGVALAFHVRSDIRRGSTMDPMDAASAYNHHPDYLFRSAPHPSVFWAVIALKLAGAALLIGAALGDLLGLWKL